MTAPALPSLLPAPVAAGVPNAPVQPAAGGGPPPLRAEPDVPDGYDDRRVQLVRDRWASQDALLAPRDREIEENLRMLAGRQWEVYSPTLGRFVNLTEFMTDAERAWRQRPVVNRLFYWFIITHARYTENDPIVTFQPATEDAQDAVLAEVMDTIFKTVWREAGMDEVKDRAAAWVVAAGHAYVKSRLELDGPPLPGQEVPVTDEAGDPVLDEAGQPVVQTPEDAEREGRLVADVLSPLEVRGEWGAKPWHEKRWHLHRMLLTPDEVRSRFGVDATPDVRPGDGQHLSGLVARVLFGAGNYGAAGGTQGAQGDGDASAVTAGTQNPRQDGYCVVDELWELPDDALTPPRTLPDGSRTPGGRLLVTLTQQGKVLHDSERPYALRGASPIRSFPFISLPGRPTGTTPLEFMKPLQRSYNRGFAQLLEHRALSTNPVVELDAASGLQPDTFVTRPGIVLPVNKRPGVEAFRYVSPPPISGDVWRIQSLLSDQLDLIGSLPGATGAAPTVDASGELVKELRFNSDRFMAAPSRRAVVEFARMVDDWTKMLPVAWPAEKVLRYAGDDSIARTLTVLPEMWGGAVNVTPDMESMLPEGRGERRQQVEHLYQLGAFGPPGSPEAVKLFLAQSRFPHLSRTVRPGGVHRVMAEHALGMLMQGAPAEQVPWFPWYDVQTHLEVLGDFLAGPEYLRVPPPVQQQMGLRWAFLAAQAQQQQQAAEQQQMRQMQMEAQARANAGAEAANRPPSAETADGPPED